MAKRRIRKKHADDWKNCPLCGKSLPADPAYRIVGSSGRAVCRDCLRTSRRLMDMPQDLEKNDFFTVLSPGEIVAKLNQSIIGQEEAKWAVAAALWKQQLRARGSKLPNGKLLLYGPTGCGKTALVQRAADIVGLPFVSFDATTLSEAGYRGRDAADMVSDLIQSCGRPFKARHGVIYVDEVDKLAASRSNEYRGEYCRGTQYSLLKLIEGSEVLTRSGDVVSTEGILFLFGGAFTGLRPRNADAKRPIGFGQAFDPQAERKLEPEDFVAYGMERELMGREGRCVELKGLTADDLRRILLESDQSVFLRYQSFFRVHGKELTLDGPESERLVNEALAMGMGARGLNALVEAWVEPQLLELAEEVHYG